MGDASSRIDYFFHLTLFGFAFHQTRVFDLRGGGVVGRKGGGEGELGDVGGSGRWKG